MRTLIIIPAYNEEEGIEKVVDNIVQNYPQYDYIVINDSVDNAANRIMAIIRAEHARTKRSGAGYIELLEETNNE